MLILGLPSILHVLYQVVIRLMCRRLLLKIELVCHWLVHVASIVSRFWPFRHVWFHRLVFVNKMWIDRLTTLLHLLARATVIHYGLQTNRDLVLSH